jgi:hypothetical protein
LKALILRLSLVVIFLAPVATSYLMFHQQRKQIKRELKRKLIAGIDRAELVHLTFSLKEKENLEWEHSKEFNYNGQYYDVIETEIQGDSVTYICWLDYEETHLYKKLDEMLVKAFGNDATQQKNTKRLNDFFKSVYFTGTLNPTVSNQELIIDFTSHYLIQSPSTFGKVPFHPPRYLNI